MKIAVATSGKGGLDDIVSPVFGRCPTFTIVEVEGDSIKGAEVLENPSMNAPGGAGIQAARMIINFGVKAVIAGNFGPNATPMFVQEGIELIPAQNVTVRDAVEKYLKKEIVSVQAPPGPGVAPSPGMGMGMGRGMGRGRGMGMGRGMSMGAMQPPSEVPRFTCPKCGCTMPKKTQKMKCPNCGTDMV
jgi:predicted Fe-Mo cluster-binding NifX family protein